MAAQKATDLSVCGPKSKPTKSHCARDKRILRICSPLLPPRTGEAVETARYLLGLFAQSAAATAPRRRKLIDCVMADFDHMLDSATSTTEKPLE